MHPLWSLIREHQVLEQLLDGLAVYANHLSGPQGARADPGDLAAFAQVFRGFGDELHHEKEEEILQPLLSRHGFHWEAGMLEEVRTDHERERSLTEVLEQAANCELAWTDEDRRSIAATALAFAEFQREHLRKENQELFPEVTRRLGSDVLDSLRAEFERFDGVPRHLTLRSEMLELAAELIDRYVPQAQAMAAPAVDNARRAAR